MSSWRSIPREKKEIMILSNTNTDQFDGQRSISRSNMIFQPIKVGTSVIPHFLVIFTEKSISYTILMFQGHSHGQKVNFKVNKVKILFLRK